MHRVLRQTALAPKTSPLSTLSPTTRRAFSTTSPRLRKQGEAPTASARHPVDNSTDDGLRDRDARGRTGGGEPLDTSVHPPPQPKIFNSQVPPEKENMDDSQKDEVKKHNVEFEKKHDVSSPAPEDKVDSKWWNAETGPNHSVKN